MTEAARPLVAASSSKPDFDVVVIGGGVNGAGVARDAALRGLRVALFERNDFAFGASGNSSGMIHGGPRYLTYDPSVTRSSCLDSGYIQKIAPHLLFRIPFLMPIEQGPVARTMLLLVDAFFDAYDRYQPLKRGKPHTRLSAQELRQVEPGLVTDTVGGVTFDEWGIDGSRLVTANILDAEEHGAHIATHTTVESVERDPKSGAPIAVRVRDLLVGRSMRFTTRVVVNASGAWSPLTTQSALLPQSASPVRGGKGIHIVYDRRLSNYAIVARTIDGRQIFLEPWENMSVLGTTDDDFYGSLDDVKATVDEVRYLEQAIARVFPSIRTARAIGTYAGVRPTLYAWGPIEDRLSREHEVIDHKSHGAPGIFSLIGGKLASYRLFAEQATSMVAEYLGVREPCRTHSNPLPGGDRILDPFALANAARLDAITARRLVYRHGSRAEEMALRMKEHPGQAFPVCPCEPVTEAEVRHVIQHEHARTVEDVSRRTRLGLGPCGATSCALHCGAIVAQELGLPPRSGQAMALQFLTNQAERRAAASNPIQARQEALARGALRAQLGFDLEGETE